MEVASQQFMAEGHQDIDTMDIDIDMDVDLDVDVDEAPLVEEVELEVCAGSLRAHLQNKVPDLPLGRRRARVSHRRRRRANSTSHIQ